MSKKFTLVGLSAIALASLSHEAQAVVTLTNTVGGTAATYSSTAAVSTTTTNLGDANFVTDVGAIDYVFDHAWFWRLAGDTREFQLSAVGAVDASLGNTGSRTWANPALGGQFSALLNMTLTDGPVAGQALLQTSMVITNTSAAPLTMSLFNYLDADVNGAGTDSSTLLGPGHARITDAAFSLEYQGLGATGFQGGVFGGAPGNLLNNALVNNLSNAGYPGGPNDYAGAWQWDVTIGVGQSLTFGVNIASNMPIPAPGALALLGLAGLVGSRRRRV